MGYKKEDDFLIRIYDGRDKFYQWDINQKVVVEDEIAKEVHFTNTVTKEALVCEVYIEDGKKVANVPNILLQTDWDIKAYAACDLCVRAAATFTVAARAKPADYVYTETETLNYNSLLERINELESNIGQNIEEYLKENPVAVDLSNYYTKSETETKIQEAQPDLSGYALKAEIPDVSNFATKDEIPEPQDLSGYALKSEIPDVSGFALKSEIPDVSEYQTADDVAAAINEALGVIENGSY